jgi:SOS-response transcriptional repressor LexA
MNYERRDQRPAGDELDDALAGEAGQELLARLYARWAEGQPGWIESVDDALLESLAALHEVAPDDAELLTRAEAEKAAREIAARIRAQRAPAIHMARGVELVRAQVTGTVSQVLSEAVARRCAPYVALSVAAGAGRELWEEECEHWVAVPDDLVPGEYLALGVQGESMIPLCRPGDVVLLKLGTDIAPGAVIVVRLPDNGYVVKRVGRVTATKLELHSVNPAFPPIVVRRTPRDVLGTVVMRWRGNA